MTAVQVQISNALVCKIVTLLRDTFVGWEERSLAIYEKFQSNTFYKLNFWDLEPEAGSTKTEWWYIH